MTTRLCVFVCTGRVVPPMGVGVIRLGEDVGGHSVLAHRPFLICAEANVGGSAGRPQNPAEEK